MEYDKKSNPAHLSSLLFDPIFDIREGKVAGLKWSSGSSNRCLSEPFDIIYFWQAFEETLGLLEKSNLSIKSFQFYLPTEPLVEDPDFFNSLQLFTEKLNLPPENFVINLPSYSFCSVNLLQSLLPGLKNQGYRVAWPLGCRQQSFNPFVSHIRIDFNQLANNSFSLVSDLKKLVSISNKNGKNLVFEQVNKPSSLFAIESSGGHLVQGRYLSRSLAIDQVREAQLLAQLLASHF